MLNIGDKVSLNPTYNFLFYSLPPKLTIKRIVNSPFLQKDVLEFKETDKLMLAEMVDLVVSSKKVFVKDML